jgi:hypothetical protein
MMCLHLAWSFELANIAMRCHPMTPAARAVSIDVEYEIQPDGRLWLRYDVVGDPERLILPKGAESARHDDLWQTTCFELFLRRPGEVRYWEFNFSPSSQWAAYQFRNYRDGMSHWAMEVPEIHCAWRDAHFTLEARVALPDIMNAPVEASLAAVIHEMDDVKSYWALKHVPEKPDFHDRDCFALKLAAPQRS